MMLDGQRDEEWAHTSSLIAILAEINRNPEKRSQPFEAEDFHPYRKRLPRPKIPIPRVGVEILKDLFVDQSRQRRKGQ